MTSLPSSLRPLRIGMFGGGTVGGGVYEIIMGRLGGSRVDSAPTPTSGCQNKNIRKCVITKICVRDLAKPRSFHIDDDETKFVSDYKSILEDKSIDLVVEVMGGTGIAKTVVLESLKRGKSVVTANKALIAEHLDEIRDEVLKTEGKAVFAYEAAVCGGIPIIQALQGCFSGDIIHEVMGICNGTTNYMLGKMEGGTDYDEVLKEAQALGYAEADPTADVEGHDVRAKIAIIAKLAFGSTVPVESIPCKGITAISSVDFEYAKLLGCTIKLIGTAERLSDFSEHDGALSVSVAPKVVPLSHLLASATGAGNAVTVKSANLGTTSYTGPGAGRFPTANSVVADICRVASGLSFADPFPLESKIDIDNDYTSAFYIRISFQDELGIIRRVGELAEVSGVSICSVLQNPIKDRMAADFVITTEECKVSQVETLCKQIGKETFAHSEPLFMPMLSS
jgi:homoserine dehydrogenase